MDGWYVIRVELVSGGGRDTSEPPPGRDVLVSPRHTFEQLADVINQSLGRWDLSHLYVFELEDGTRVERIDEEDFDEPGAVDATRTKVARRRPGETLVYTFDLGDLWEHRLTVLEVDVDPVEVYGVAPDGPAPVWGSGSIPDQHGRTTPDA